MAEQTTTLRDGGTSALRTQGVRRTENVGVFTPTQPNVRQTNQEAVKEMSNIQRDLERLEIGGKQVVGSMYEASEWADKIRSNDAYTNFVVGMQNIDKHYQDKVNKGVALTVADYKEKKDWQTKYYDTMIADTIMQGDDTNLFFKTNFIDPATEVLDKTNAADTKAQFIVHRRNVIDQVNKNLDVMGTNATVSSVEFNIQQLKAVGVGGAREKVWGQVANSMNSAFTDKFMNGIDSPAAKQYLEDGVLTEKGKEQLFNDTFGKFAKLQNGEFSKQTSDITDEAYDAMKKTFSSWNKGVGKQIKAKMGAGQETITDTVGKVSVTTTSAADVDAAIESVGKQYSEIGGYLSPSKQASVKDAMVKLSDKKSEIDLMESIYSEVMGDAPINFDELMAQDFKIQESERTIAPNVTVTTTAKTIPRADIETRIDNNFYKDYQTAMQKGTPELASTMGKKLAQMKDSGFNGASSTNLMKNTITSFTNTGGKSIKSLNELKNELWGASSYVEASGIPNSSFLGGKAINRVEAYITGLQEQAKTNDKLTEAEILTRTKSYVYGLSREFDSIKNGYKTAKILDTLTGDVGQQDALVSGYVVGETRFASGVFNTLNALAYKEDVTPANVDQFKEYAKSKTMEIDSSYLPIFGTSISIINPTKSNTTESQSRVRDNMQKLVNEALKSSNIEKRADISDLSDEDDVKIFQYSDQNGDVMTVVNIYSSGKILLPVVMSPRNLETGTWEIR